MDPLRISIVTPSFNQARFLDRTIRSVLDQDPPPAEYLVLDGGSTDGSAAIIRAHERSLAYWVSEPDRGQADAVNKGWRRCTSDIVGYLNSDDTLRPGALAAVSDCFQRHPQAAMVYGFCRVIDEQDRPCGTRRVPAMTLERILRWDPPIIQPAVFWRRDAVAAVGWLDAGLHYTMDYDLYLRVASKFPIQRLPRFLANARRHPTAKTAAAPLRHVEEAVRVANRFLDAHPDLGHLRSRVAGTFRLRQAHVHCLAGHGALARAAIADALRLAPDLRAAAIPVWLKSLIPLPLANQCRRLFR